MSATTPTDYLYDVFISYSRTGDIKKFVTLHFYPKLCDWLREELGREVKVFIDEEEIPGNEHWPEGIADRLLASKCLVPVLTGRYFFSEWCLSEWLNFVEREKLLGLYETRKSLIVPAIYHDGKMFREEANRYIHEKFNFKECGSSSSKFEEHASYPEFERKIKGLAADVAEVVKRAPSFNSAWPKTVFTPNEPTVPLLTLT